MIGVVFHSGYYDRTVRQHAGFRLMEAARVWARAIRYDWQLVRVDYRDPAEASRELKEWADCREPSVGKREQLPSLESCLLIIGIACNRLLAELSARVDNGYGREGSRSQHIELTPPEEHVADLVTPAEDFDRSSRNLSHYEILVRAVLRPDSSPAAFTAHFNLRSMNGGSLR